MALVGGATAAGDRSGIGGPLGCTITAMSPCPVVDEGAPDVTAIDMSRHFSDSRWCRRQPTVWATRLPAIAVVGGPGFEGNYNECNTGGYEKPGTGQEFPDGSVGCDGEQRPDHYDSDCGPPDMRRDPAHR